MTESTRPVAARPSARSLGSRTAPLTERAQTLRRNLASMSGDALSFNLMVGIGEAYFAAFALALGLGDVIAGLVASAPILAGAILQLVSPAAVRRLGSHRRWVVLCANLQAATFLPLVLGALTGYLPAPALFVAVALYWGFGLGTSSAWNTWVETLVPRSLRTHYFTFRSRISQAALLVGLLAGGAILHAGDRLDQRLVAFALVFGLGAAFRLTSGAFLARQSEPLPLAPVAVGGPFEILVAARRAGSTHLLGYLLAVQSTVHVAASFFTPYMLGPLALSYGGYVTLVAASFVAKIAALPLLGRIARRFGTRRLLWLGGLGIVPLPALWVLAGSYEALLGIQILAGISWGSYELATTLLVFESIRSEHRTSVLTLFNLANAVAMLAGAAVGGLLLDTLGRDPSAYAALFLVSSLARAFTLPLLRRVPDLHKTPVIPAMRPLAARPSAGSIERPVLPSLPNGAGEPGDQETAPKPAGSR